MLCILIFLTFDLAMNLVQYDNSLWLVTDDVGVVSLGQIYCYHYYNFKNQKDTKNNYKILKTDHKSRRSPNSTVQGVRSINAKVGSYLKSVTSGKCS